MITFTIPGVPVAKGRPRFTRMGRAYTPKKTADYEHTVAWYARIAMGGRKPLDGPVEAIMTFWLPIPPSWRNSKQLAAQNGTMQHTSRADIDNYCKGSFDGMNGIVFLDDAQIVRMVVEKRYGVDPRAEVCIRPHQIVIV